MRHLRAPLPLKKAKKLRDARQETSSNSRSKTLRLTRSWSSLTRPQGKVQGRTRLQQAKARCLLIPSRANHQKRVNPLGLRASKVLLLKSQYLLLAAMHLAELQAPQRLADRRRPHNRPKQTSKMLKQLDLIRCRVKFKISSSKGPIKRLSKQFTKMLLQRKHRC